MRDFDFLSQSSNQLILGNDRNQKVFGGVLFLIYILISFIIYLYYLTIYGYSLKYDIISFVSQEKILSNKEKEKFAESEKYNPIIKLRFSITSYNKKDLSNKFIIADTKNLEQIKIDETIERRINDIDFYILYDCKGKTDCEVDNKDRDVLYYLNIYYQGFYIAPQNDIPIKKRVFDEKHFSSSYISFNPDTKLHQNFMWIVTRFEDAKGIKEFFHNIFKGQEADNIKENDLYIGGHFQRDENRIVSKGTNVNGNRLMLRFYVIGTRYTNYFLYEDYKRKENSILDYLADIFSLCNSLYQLISFVYTRIYSNNFDQYKIIDNILLSNKKVKISKKQIIRNRNELENANVEDNILGNDSFYEKDENLIINDEKELENDDINKNDGANFFDKEEEIKRILPKRRFYDFIYNTIYNNIYCNNGKQDMIDDCKEILSKYLSIEKILYNQIIIENLLKDYKWNNPKLKNILNNKSFDKINNNL